MNPLHDLKMYQKDLAHAIRLDRKDDSAYKSFCTKYKLNYIPGGLSYEFRHNHIAYCELRGRTRDQIEKPADCNLPNEVYIEKIKSKWMEKINETICIN